MLFSTVLLAFAALGAPSAFASPVSLEGRNITGIDQVLKRQSADRICGDENPYSASFQAQTFEYASQSYSATGLTARGSVGDRVYPHEFENRKNEVTLPDCPGVPGPYQEFPIRQGGLLFADGVDQGSDRIIYKITATNPANGLPDNFVYCGVITHLGARRNKFVTCPNV
ncbi:hypothetical protein DTO166G4_6472 [Paecilomyces variotii]|uniref:ribonuclease T1 n=1 Tax=Byssochlamys spectabilis TaxID=264951 RepID=A0A443HU26_BYSSP|nr:hypothetical protein C8Q69DRAFT_469740 [Paecilomyces variotii]KAJ9192861.1 hypothetical protein DTO032I3_8097 [Paecilomyces variotii]KAJ9193183.1 hypothetical protein DTO164E3_8007 [Paecilomyces variotii]KAJ9211944.1 hypothetical protein DTO166G4_6472 [Paecilomyces variotii]KAJ9219995.1 hypothetical protein DTO169C6_7652 [Paecilomyces variotii]KAJ9231963.1 hypothetical protein DTO166G5_6494 [Paecilomyces variotii]